MNKTMKTFLILGVILLVVGLAVFLIGLGLNDWKLNTDYTSETFTASGDNTSLDLGLSAGEMNVVFYDGETVQVDYPVSANRGYKVTEHGGVVSVKPLTRVHISFFGWDKIPAVTVKIPNGKVMNLDFDISAGKATVASGKFGNVGLKMSAGTMHVGEIECADFECKLSAGTISVSGVDCPSTKVKLSAGSATLSGVTSDDITVKLSAGSAHLSVKGQKADYSISVDKSAGSCNVSSQTGAVAGKVIDIDLSAGSVAVNFSD